MTPAKSDVKLCNIFFPVWMLLLLPVTWLIVLPGNFIVDSLVLLVSMAVLKIPGKKQWYKKHILPVWGFGFLADLLGAGCMFLMLLIFQDLGADSMPLAIFGLLVSAAFIFVFNYFVIFRKADKAIRLRSALIFATVTAPYTFLIPITWIY